jgi:toxin-antitoxin system PIN domain toxin
MTFLLDGNMLIALALPDHVHAGRARAWFVALEDSFATCPITQGSLMRAVLREKSDVSTASAILTSIVDLPNHVFWPDALPYRDVRLQGVIGHRQVTDAYLAQLARENEGRLATFDSGLAALHRDVADLIE